MRSQAPNPDVPLRLSRRQGQWSLEVSRLVPVDRNVQWRETHRLTDVGAITLCLRDSCSPPTVKAALDLMVEPFRSDAVFDLVEDRWVRRNSSVCTKQTRGLSK